MTSYQMTWMICLSQSLCTEGLCPRLPRSVYRGKARNKSRVAVKSNDGGRVAMVSTALRITV